MSDAPATVPMTHLADAWDRLRHGQSSADHPFRTAALATADALGRPDVRTVVLRRVDPAARVLEFQTDRRSPKFTMLHHNQSAAWLFYDAATQLQLRLQTSTALHTHDPVADEAWAAVPVAMRTPYCCPLMPGADLPGPAVPAATEADGDGRDHFAVVRCAIESLEWLRREEGIWRRVRFTWPNGECRWQWLSP